MRVDLRTAPALPSGSCFASLDEAQRILKYQPVGLSCDQRGIKLAEIFRNEDDWRERPVAVVDHEYAFFRKIGQTDVALELATWVEPIDYRWRLGRRVP